MPQDGKLYLRRHEGIKDWFNMIQVQCIFLWCQELVCGARICILPTLFLYPFNIVFVSFLHCIFILPTSYFYPSKFVFVSFQHCIFILPTSYFYPSKIVFVYFQNCICILPTLSPEGERVREQAQKEILGWRKPMPRSAKVITER